MANKTWLFASSNPENEAGLFQWMLGCCHQQAITLRIVVVLPKLGHHVFDWFETQQHQDLIKKQTEYEMHKRQQWLDLAEAQQVDLAIEVRFGKLFYESIQVANETNVELLIKQTEDIEQKDNLLFESVDWHLLRKSPVPLLLYRPKSPLPFKNIMASVDVDIETRPFQPSQFNQSLLSWAQRFNHKTPLNVVHAWQSDVDHLVRHWNTDLDESALIKLNEQLYLEHKKALDVELAAHFFQSQKPKVLLCKGEPAHSISSAVLEQNVDLLVLGTLGRSGLPGLLIGNTAEDLLERVNCSVLAIKPSTFKSPII